MSVPAVFVYGDGMVALRDLEREFSVYLQVRTRPFVFGVEMEPKPLSMDYDEYPCRGHMFDGRPVYVAAGCDVIEARFSGLASNRTSDIEAVDSQMRRDVRRFVEQNYTASIELDEWVGDCGYVDSEELNAQNLAKRSVRLLIAARPVTQVARTA
mgnify:CR=1 FL=1